MGSDCGQLQTLAPMPDLRGARECFCREGRCWNRWSVFDDEDRRVPIRLGRDSAA